MKDTKTKPRENGSSSAAAKSSTRKYAAVPDYSFYKDLDVMENVLLPDTYGTEKNARREKAPEIVHARCFSSKTAGMGDTLRRYIDEELSAYAYYQVLASRAPQGRHRGILRMAALLELRHARRFSATYFIATGISYFPQKEIAELRIPPYKLALRERYLEESATFCAYQNAANNCGDLCLKELLTSTANDELQHAEALRELLEELP